MLYWRGVGDGDAFFEICSKDKDFEKAVKEESKGNLKKASEYYQKSVHRCDPCCAPVYFIRMLHYGYSLVLRPDDKMREARSIFSSSLSLLRDLPEASEKSCAPMDDERWVWWFRFKVRLANAYTTRPHQHGSDIKPLPDLIRKTVTSIVNEVTPIVAWWHGDHECSEEEKLAKLAIAGDLRIYYDVATVVAVWEERVSDAITCKEEEIGLLQGSLLMHPMRAGVMKLLGGCYMVQGQLFMRQHRVEDSLESWRNARAQFEHLPNYAHLLVMCDKNIKEIESLGSRRLALAEKYTIHVDTRVDANVDKSLVKKTRQQFVEVEDFKAHMVEVLTSRHKVRVPGLAGFTQPAIQQLPFANITGAIDIHDTKSLLLISTLLTWAKTLTSLGCPRVSVQVTDCVDLLLLQSNLRDPFKVLIDSIKVKSQRLLHEKQCLYCKATCAETGTMKHCYACSETRYCSSCCQKSDWSRHKPLCRLLIDVQKLLDSTSEKHAVFKGLQKRRQVSKPRDIRTLLQEDPTQEEEEEEEQAEETVKQLVDPHASQELRNAGNQAFKSGDFHIALDLYSQAVALSSSGDHAHLAACFANRAACHTKLMNWENVILDCKEALKHEPMHLKAYYRRAGAHEALQQWHRAHHDLARVIELDPELHETRLDNDGELVLMPKQSSVRERCETALEKSIEDCHRLNDLQLESSLCLLRQLASIKDCIFRHLSLRDEHFSCIVDTAEGVVNINHYAKSGQQEPDHRPLAPVWSVPILEEMTANIRSSETSRSTVSGGTVISWMSAPARSSFPHCFLPDTAFQSASNGVYIRAAELCRAGGNKLLGANGCEVVVVRATKIPTADRDLVALRMEGAAGVFMVTADHRLFKQGPTGRETPCEAREFVQENAAGRQPQIFDGTHFCLVELATCFTKATSLVEVVFDGDLAALAYILPRRRRSLPVVGFPLAVLGTEPTTEDLGLVATRTFLNPAGRRNEPPRSASMGAPPNPKSLWSVGTVAHSDDFPERCNICATHHRFLIDSMKVGSANASPCRAGAACQRCHACHDEQPGRMRH
mmetsp:Transcript_119880/g.238676  ORF Transcript_119880/g.238676 Transcript_119880/m.238676 type:complete len:1052 (-) Transcript_119880:121-3276(-)